MGEQIRFRPTLGPFPVSDQWENKSCSDVTGSEVGLGPGCSPSFAANSGYDLAGVVLAAPTCHWLRPRWLSLVASGPALRLASGAARPGALTGILHGMASHVGAVHGGLSGTVPVLAPAGASARTA